MAGDEILVVEKPRGQMAVVDDVLHDDLADLFGLLDAFGGHVENGIDQIFCLVAKVTVGLTRWERGLGWTVVR